MEYIKIIMKFLHNWRNTPVVKIFGYVFLFKLLLKSLILAKNSLKYNIKKIPYIKGKIDDETHKVIKTIKSDFNNEIKELISFSNLPDNSITEDKIVEYFTNMKQKYSYDFRNGRVSGSVYAKNHTLDLLHNKLYLYFNKSNPLHTNVFPSIRLMENNLVSMMIKLFNGKDNVCGVFTSGGTESILLACKSYRDYFKHIKNPEIIVSSTVHCAFNKACGYFKIKLITIPCNIDGTFNTEQLETKINQNTILIVGSTPSYNLGIIDPIHSLAQIALKYNIPLHVDACIGAFLINYSEINYDFSIKGVTSISADFHKYGHSPKGASCIMYSKKEILENQYFIDEEWSGGIYATSTITGSRSGNVVALTWATLLSYGNDTYRANYNKIVTMKNHLIAEINQISGLYIIGDPKLSIVAISSDKININLLAEELKKKEWDLNIIQNPNGFHMCLTSYHTIEILNQFIKDIRLLVPIIKDNNDKYSPCIYGTMQKINDNAIIRDVVSNYLHVVNGVNLDYLNKKID